MNIAKTSGLRLPKPRWERHKSYREFVKWIFAFGAIITVLSGLLYISS
jgi:hypothetical protein